VLTLRTVDLRGDAYQPLMSQNVTSSRHAAQPYDSVGQMLVFAETLNHALRLIAEDTLAKDRIALIAVDHLAELLLHRYARQVFASSGGSWAFPRPQYSATERHRIHHSSDRMIRLAQEHVQAPWGRDVPPILSSDDARLFRVAHSYRNDIYHEDRHNQALLSPLTVLYAQAVGRAFVAGYPAGNTTSLPREEADALTDLGCTIEPDSVMPNIRMMTYRDAVQQIVDRALDGWEVSFKDFREHLAADINDRALIAARVLERLLDDGMPEEEIEGAFWTAQFWETHGADAELLRLDRARLDQPEDPAATQAYLEHLKTLQASFRPAVQLRGVRRFKRLGQSLGKAQTMANLLDRYLKLDQQIGLLHQTTGAAAEAWEHAQDTWD
jgi:hypothetical protein